MRPFLFAIICAFFLVSCSVAQSITKSELAGLQRTIYYYFKGPTWPETKQAKEAFLLVMHINEVGKVSSVSTLARDGYKDSMYMHFNKMQASNFDGWVLKKASNKIIIVPLVLASDDDDAKSVLQASGLDLFDKASEGPTIITLQYIVFSWFHSVR